MRLIIFLLPWLELFSLIQLGIATSAFTALAWVLLSLIAGLALLQWRGREVMRQLRVPGVTVLGARLLGDEMAWFTAGLLLMIPGLITDFAAVLLLIGPLRRRLFAALRRAGPDGPDHPSEPLQGDTRRPSVTLEGEYRRLDD